MAKEFKKNTRTVDDDSSNENKKNQSGAKTKGRSQRNNRRRNSGFKNRTADTASDSATSTTTSSIGAPSTPNSSANTLVFPADSAAMASFGNYITTAGQENFIEHYNTVKNPVAGSGLTNRIVIEAEWLAKKTPNAMRIDIVPLFGATSSYPSSYINPLQLAALNLKQYIDTSFGTNTRYDAQDLMVYLMATAAVFPWIAEIKRDLRLVMTTLPNAFPQYLPRGAFNLLDLRGDAGDHLTDGVMYTAEHLRSLIDQLNQVILMFNALPKPPEIAAFGYNDDLFEYIYLDSEDPSTAQQYYFKNGYLWFYEDTLFNDGPAVVPHKLAGGSYSIGDKINLLFQQVSKLSALRTSDTAMLQNLFNAYGSRDTVLVPLVDFTSLTPLEFVYDVNILTTIENMNICLEAEVGAYVGRAANSNLQGALYIPHDGDRTHCAPMFNLPLQFHKPFDQITREDIGHALRMHTAFLTHTQQQVPKSDGTYETLSVITSDAFTGFAACVGVHVGYVSENGIPMKHDLTGRAVHSGWELSLFNDFSHAPIFVDYSHNGSWNVGETLTLKLVYYTAARDVEVTYRLEDMSMHWVYLTQSIWAANVIRTVSGTRS